MNNIDIARKVLAPGSDYVESGDEPSEVCALAQAIIDVDNVTRRLVRTYGNDADLDAVRTAAGLVRIWNRNGAIEEEEVTP